MRASACKQQLDIDSSSFTRGHCPHTVTSVRPDEESEGSGDEEEEDDEDEYDGSTAAAPANRRREEDERRGKDSEDDGDGGGSGTTSKRVQEGNRDHAAAGAGADADADDELKEELSPSSPSDLNEKEAFGSKLCRNVICPIGALCKLRRSREEASSTQQVFCDCSLMCERISQLSLATTWIKEPVCGSNGVLYPNECRLRQDSCIRNTTIHIMLLASDGCRVNASFSPPTSVAAAGAAGHNNHRPNDLHG